MNKEKMKSLASWVVIGVLGVLSITGVAFALSGSFPIGIETCNSCSFDVSSSAEVSDEIGSGTANRIPHGYMDTSDGYYVDGTEVISNAGVFVSSIAGTSATLSGQLNYLESYELATATDTLAVAESG